MADQPTTEDLQRQHKVCVEVEAKLWHAWREIQKATANHRELSEQSVTALLHMAAILAVDISADPEVLKQRFEMLYQQAYARAPKFS